MFSNQTLLRSKKKLLFLAASALSLIVFAQSASAYVSYKLLSVPVAMQEQSNWCWAAVDEMIADFFGANATQTDIVKYVKGSVTNTTATIDEMKTGLAKYSILSTTATYALTFQTLVNNIEAGGPVATAIVWQNGTGAHAHTIYGYYQYTEMSKQNVYYIDPYDGSKNITNYSLYKDNSIFYWKSSLYNISK